MKALLLLLALQADPKDEALEWSQHLGAAVRMALQRKAQILVVFSTKSCGWCRRLKEETLKDPSLRAELESRVLVALDLDDAAEIGAALGARAVPDVRLYSPEGLPLARQLGYLAAPAFLAWLKAGSAATPLAEEPSLKSLRLDSALDVYFDLDARKQPLPAALMGPLLALAAGPPGESRTEALRLVRKWAAPNIAALLAALRHERLKIRLAAYEALSDLGAPLGKADPWAGPVTLDAALEIWAARTLPSAAPAEAAPAAEAWTPALEADLRAVEEGDRNAAARERLIAGGAPLVPRLRERARGVRGASPAAASRLDEVRFRILLTPEVLRRSPDGAARLAVGSAGLRSQALEEILKRYPRGLEGLVKEALCDVDPLFRETGATFARVLLGPDALEALSALLQDPESNVRSVALRELAGLPTKGTAEAIRDYLAREKSPELIAAAVRSLQEVKTKTSRDVLRTMLKSPHWTVRGAAIRALVEVKDPEALPAVVDLLHDPDEFVIGQAMQALSKWHQSLQPADIEAVVRELSKVVEQHPKLLPAVLQMLGKYPFQRASGAEGILQKHVAHADGATRAAAIGALASSFPGRSHEEIRAALADRDLRVRTAAAAGLRSQETLKVVNRRLADGQTLEGYAETRVRLLDGLRDGDADLRLECALSMIYFGDYEAAAPAWAGFLNSASDGVRKRALEAFEWFGPADALREQLRRRAWSNEERASILYRIRDQDRGQDLAPMLVELLPELPKELRAAWSGALLSSTLHAAMSGSDAAAVESRRAFAERLRKFAEEAPRGEPAAILRSMAWSLQSAPKEEELRAGLRDPEPILRWAALATLLRAEVVFSVAEIEPLVRDASPAVRALALVACFAPDDRSLFEDLRRQWYGTKEKAWHYGSGSYTSGRDKRKLLPLPEALLNERLQDSDPDVRLRAAVLMTVEGSDEALAYLHKVWREAPERETREFLVRGVIGAWEDAYTSILEEVYDSYGGSEWELKQLYGKIGALKGKRVAAFRARMRRELPGAND